MCADGWDMETDKHHPVKANGTCPDCGEDTYDGEAVVGCHHSPVECETCGSAPCKQYC